MSIKGSLFRNLSAGAWSNISNVLIRFMEVPLLLAFLGVEDYGRWLVLSSLPAWLTLANLGFGSVASNEMTMAVAAGEMGKARSFYSTAFALIIGVGIAGLVLCALLVPFIPWEHFLHVSSDRQREFSFAVIWLVMSVFVSFSAELFGGRFRAAKQAHKGMFIASFKPWISLLLLFVVLNFSKRFDYIAFASFCSIVLYLLVLGWLSGKALPQLRFSLQEVERKWLRGLFRKGIAFQAFPLGNALLFQGNLLVVQAILGPAAVALFGTARTLVRSVNQVLGLISHSIWPELSYMFGASDMVRVARLHRIGVGLSIVVACVGVLGLAVAGPFLYELWVGKSIELPRYLLMFFLLPIPFNALWITSSVVHSACNQHEGLAKRYLFATVLSLLFCLILSYFQGIEGAAVSTLVADVVLIPYVFTRSLMLTADRWKTFIPGMAQEALALLVYVRKPSLLSSIWRSR